MDGAGAEFGAAWCGAWWCGFVGHGVSFPQRAEGLSVGLAEALTHPLRSPSGEGSDGAGRLAGESL